MGWISLIADKEYSFFRSEVVISIFDLNLVEVISCVGFWLSEQVTWVSYTIFNSADFYVGMWAVVLGEYAWTVWNIISSDNGWHIFQISMDLFPLEDTFLGDEPACTNVSWVLISY